MDHRRSHVGPLPYPDGQARGAAPLRRLTANGVRETVTRALLSYGKNASSHSRMSPGADDAVQHERVSAHEFFRLLAGGEYGHGPSLLRVPVPAGQPIGQRQ